MTIQAANQELDEATKDFTQSMLSLKEAEIKLGIS